MKKLIIVRHAKSSWEYDVIDHERPLTERGITDAGVVSTTLKKMSFSPDFVITSDALRAKSTADIFVANLNISSDIFKQSHELYDFSGEKLLSVIRGIDNTFSSVMVFGHNHALTYFVNTFGNKYIDNVPTSGVVIIEFDIDDWKYLTKGNTVKTIFPRDFR